VANSEERSQSILATLEQCRSALTRNGDHETAHVVSVAILQHRMKRYGVSDLELKELCDAIVADREAAEAARHPEAQRHRRRRPPLLRLVK
jgi:phage terminase large subunit-like protein